MNGNMTAAVKNHLKEFQVVAEIPVAWADMDVFRHVNNTVFFRYFETARIKYLERIGFTDDLGMYEGAGPILHSTHCRFRRPVVFPDTVWTGARSVKLHSDRFVMEYRVVSEKLGEVAAEGGGVVVAFDYHARSKTTLPRSVSARIEEIDGHSFG
ncbi:MAG TPA: thioesterase family protein [Longimicrobiaceae bacterium]|nr:thioesterase family protein [Longimicrobiaceae bacterium]